MATKIKTIKIHPAIGIARLGNSPTTFFIGPEKPGVHRRPNGGYKDKQGRIQTVATKINRGASNARRPGFGFLATIRMASS